MQYDYTPSIIVFLGLFTIMAASLLIILYWWRKDSSEYNKRARRAEHDQFSSTSVTISGHDQLLGSLSAISYDVIEIRKAIERLVKEIGNAKGGVQK